VSEADPPACWFCGVCCFSTLDRYVRVSGDDHARLGDRAASLVHFIGNRAYMQMAEGRCAALALDQAGRWLCSVYDHRPEVCRALERGSRACSAERALKGERPLLALRKKPPDG
jgi:Fe-S-cluster containining protein